MVGVVRPPDLRSADTRRGSGMAKEYVSQCGAMDRTF